VEQQQCHFPTPVAKCPTQYQTTCFRETIGNVATAQSSQRRPHYLSWRRFDMAVLYHYTILTIIKCRPLWYTLLKARAWFKAVVTSIDQEVVGNNCVQLLVGHQGRRAVGTTVTVARVQVKTVEQRGQEGNESGTRTDVDGVVFVTGVCVVDSRIPSNDPNNGEVESFVRSWGGLRCQILSHPCRWRSTLSCREA
jgi:hypothetical protein